MVQIPANSQKIVGKWFIWCSLVWDSQKYQWFLDSISSRGPPKNSHSIKGNTKGKILKINNSVFLFPCEWKLKIFYFSATLGSGRLIWYPYCHTFGILYDCHKCHEMTFYGIYDGHKEFQKYGNMGIKLTVLIPVLQKN